MFLKGHIQQGKIMEEGNSKKLVLLFGATGRTGYHIAQKFSQQGYKIRVFCRSREKLLRMFGQHHQFHSIIEGDITNSQDIRRAFQGEEVKIVVSALGARPADRWNVADIEYQSQVNIINQCKEKQIELYALVSVAFIQRPCNIVSIALNWLIPDVMHWKQEAENYLRMSGLDYVIVRPPEITGDHMDLTLTPYQISQGDNLPLDNRLTISSRTLGHVTYDAIFHPHRPHKVTFQCKNIETLNEDLCDFSSLVPDTKKSIIHKWHRPAKYFCLFMVIAVICGIIALIVCLN